MIRTAYLRVYQALDEFSLEERARWSQPGASGDGSERVSARWVATSALPQPGTRADEGAFVREMDGRIFICPWRTRLRMLAGLLAFRGSLHEEIADAFVPEREARRAAQELAAITKERPDIRSHILHANWHIPLRWFAAFDGTERVLLEDKHGVRIRYETSLQEARARLESAIEILESGWVDEAITAAVRELNEWVEQFSGDGLLELDYASVAGLFDEEALVDDHSAAEVWSCLDALGAGDLVRAGRIFTTLSDRWGAIRAHEVVN